uniref:Ig-like domain-containing protein n=1 Tax=Salvator merianae TaxID=96440 RepID=A0A8D0C850_SALMN
VACFCMAIKRMGRKRPGQTVKLSCSLSTGTVTSYDQVWLQQKDGGSPRFLYYYYSSASAGSGDLSRFSASKESSQNTWYLTISNLQPEDEAVYYCAVWYNSPRLEVSLLSMKHKICT